MYSIVSEFNGMSKRRKLTVNVDKSRYMDKREESQFCKDTSTAETMTM